MNEAVKAIAKAGEDVKFTEKDSLRFWSKVRIGAVDECWPWRAYRLSGGYGQFSLRGANILAHRFAWADTFGNASIDMCVCHSCDNPRCCNPAHFWLGTKGDNNRDRTQKGRAAKGVRNRHNKLSEEQVRSIRREYATGRTSHKRLAAKYGVTYRAIACIVTYETWKHI